MIPTSRCRRPWPALVLPALLALLPAAALADWVKVGETAAVALYMDRSSLRRTEDTWRVWEIQDLRAADPDGVRSRRYVNEYDCRNRMHRIGRMTSHAGPMLTGAQLFEVEEFGYWRTIPAAGLFTRAYTLHCGAGAAPR